MRSDPLGRLRRICLALPASEEKEAWGAPTFRVKGRLFAMYAHDHHGDGRIAVWCKAPPGAQEMLVEGDPESFFRPPYVGPSGWIGVRLDRGLDWGLVSRLVGDAWRLAAPARLAAAFSDGPGTSKPARSKPEKSRPGPVPRGRKRPR